MKSSTRSKRANQADLTKSGKWFAAWLGGSLWVYLGLILLLVAADVWYVVASLDGSEKLSDILDWDNLWRSVRLTFISSTISAILSVVVAVPIGYLLSRYRFFGRSIIDAILDIPVVLPPLVIGLSLLILFNSFPPKALDWGVNSLDEMLLGYGFRVTHTKLAIVIAQFTVACAFSIRTMKVAFDQIDSRSELVAMTMGASRGRAFFDVVLPQTRHAVVAAGMLAWARSLGEFGPILVFAGATRGKTEVLSTSIYLEINTGNLKGAVLISLILIMMAIVTTLIVRMLTQKGLKDDLY